jgi:hypothetical protein
LPNESGTRTAAVLVALILASVLPAAGDGGTHDYRSVVSQSFGPNQSVLVVPGAAFTPTSSSVFERDQFDYIYFTAGMAGSRFAWAALPLPPGARIRMVCAFFDDTNATYAAHMTLQTIRHSDPLGPTPPVVNTMATVASGGTGYSIECENVDVTVVNRTDVDEDGNIEIWSWVLRAGTDFATSSLRFGGAYILWERQVSPAPDEASFQDVPENHPFFAYVEALKAAGISQPCDVTNNFCPDNPMTRGQMAMWLAKALGLFWQAP